MTTPTNVTIGPAANLGVTIDPTDPGGDLHHPEDARMGFPLFSPNDGETLPQLDAWTNRIENMLIRVNSRLRTTEGNMSAAITSGIDTFATRQEIQNFQGQAEEAFNQSSAIRIAELQTTQVKVEMEFNRQRANLQEVVDRVLASEAVVNNLISEAGVGFEELAQT